LVFHVTNPTLKNPGWGTHLHNREAERYVVHVVQVEGAIRVFVGAAELFGFSKRAVITK
jgi:hypothetical protein